MNVKFKTVCSKPQHKYQTPDGTMKEVLQILGSRLHDGSFDETILSMMNKTGLKLKKIVISMFDDQEHIIYH